MKIVGQTENITNKVTKQKQIVNTVKKDNGQRKVKKIAQTFAEAVGEINDPRQRIGRVDYPLNEILFTALVAVVCGSESFYDIETFGQTQHKWLKKFYPYKNGAPSHDTYTRVFQLLNPKSLENAYRLVIEGLKIRNTKHIAIDGKTSRGCYNIKGQCLLHVVSAWDTENGITLGQIATKNDEGKDVGEYNTIPALIESVDIKEALVTIDAGGCYTEIVDAVVAGGGHYLVTLKDNQPTLLNEAKAIFSEHQSNDFEGVERYQESSQGHGRIEERTYYAVPLPADSPVRKKWRYLETLVMGIFYRNVKGKESREIRYMISDLPCDQIQRMGRGFREHWGIENRLHWVLDVSFGEDANRTRTGHAAENLGKLRRLAIGLMGKVKGKKTIPTIMFQAALSTEFRTTIVEQLAKTNY
jgi:predicted transposase YbfD/YdcC